MGRQIKQIKIGAILHQISSDGQGASSTFSTMRKIVIGSIDSAAMLPTKKSAGVTPEVDVRNLLCVDR